MNEKIPVTVLTGFLGSGKTTLLNRILSESHGQRIAVIENEFGEVGIDQDLVINADEEIFEMNNGCICCTVRGDLIRILGNLIKRRERFDRIILETTGMADPGPVAQTFFVDADIRDEFRLDGVITLVDAKHISQHIDESEEALAQVAFGDLLVLNKTDLVTQQELESLHARLRKINNMAQIIPARMADAPLNKVLDVGGFDLERALETRPAFLEPEYPFEWGGIFKLSPGIFELTLEQGPDPAMSILMTSVDSGSEESLANAAENIFQLFSGPAVACKPGESLSMETHCELDLDSQSQFKYRFSITESGYYALYTQHTPEEFNLAWSHNDDPISGPVVQHFYNAGHTHDDTVSSVSLTFPGSLHEQRFSTWMQILMQSQGQDIFRTKGILNFHGEDCRFILQGVHMLLEGQPGQPWGDEPRLNRLVFIGRNLDAEFLEGAFKACLT
jgi:G3E family GTPase